MPSIQYTDGAFGEPRVSHVTHNIENIERYTQGLQVPRWVNYEPIRRRATCSASHRRLRQSQPEYWPERR